MRIYKYPGNVKRPTNSRILEIFGNASIFVELVGQESRVFYHIYWISADVGINLSLFFVEDKLQLDFYQPIFLQPGRSLIFGHSKWSKNCTLWPVAIKDVRTLDTGTAGTGLESKEVKLIIDGQLALSTLSIGLHWEMIHFTKKKLL